MAKAASGSNNRRTAILGGAAFLVLGAAAGWIYYGDELLELTGLAEPAPVAVKPAATPAVAAKGAPPAEAAKPAAPVAAGTPAAAADAAKPAASAAPPKGEAPADAAKPAPAPEPASLSPDEAITEVLKRSGADRLTKEFHDSALEGVEPAPGRPKLSPEAAQALRNAVERTLAVDKLDAQLRADLRKGYDPARFAAFIDVLKTPINEKMTRLEMQEHTPEQVKQFLSRFSSSPPSPERRHVIGRIDTIAQISEFRAEMALMVVRNIAQAMDPSPKDASARDGGKQIEATRKALKAQTRALLFLVYRTASEADLNEYAALLESEAGRWGMALLANATRKLIDGASRELGTEMARVAAQTRASEQTPAPARDAGPAGPTAGPAPRPEAQAPAVPSLPADSPLVYARHNDLISAVTVGDYASVRELLADGKNPDSRATSGYTALMVAVRQRDVEMAQILLERGANPSLRAAGGESAMSLAQAAKHRELVRLLGRYGARP